jgi:hypothetical protein
MFLLVEHGHLSFLLLLLCTVIYVVCYWCMEIEFVATDSVLTSSVINSSKHCIYLSIIQHFSSSLRVNTTFLQYNDTSVNVV